MIRYKSDLVVSPLFDGKSWSLQQDFHFTVGGRDWAVPKGFRTDFASIPWIARLFIGSPATGLYRYAAVLHDWFYSTHELDKETADDVFYTAMLEDGVDGWKAKLMYLAVKFGGSSSYNKR